MLGMPERKTFYTLDEVAELLGVSRTTVGRLVRSGKLRVARLGQRTVRVSAEALGEFIKTQETTGPASFPHRHPRANGGDTSGGKDP